ncbi:MAG: peptidylprolyl isomerase [Cytophagales bacterium]|nr:peptidylprolyl isomerase [Rhizobacter sp.]
MRAILDLRFAALALICACTAHVLAADTALPSGVVATVNGQPVQRSVLDQLAKARHGDTPTGSIQDRARMLNDLVTMELLSQRAHATGVAARPGARAELELAHKTLLGQHLMQQLAADMVITDEALQARYQQAQPELSITASHILLPDEANARQVIAQLDAGASFAATARKLSADEYTRDKGGQLGTVNGSNLEPAFVDAARAMKPGTISRMPVRTVHGWHVIQLHTMRGLEKPSLEEMKPALRSQLVTERVQAQVAQWRKDARLTKLQAP